MATVQYKTPGVYLSERDSFPPAVVGVETAVPAFIGYTASALEMRKDLTLTPTRISSMAEFIARFGGRFRGTYKLLASAAPLAKADRVVGKISFYAGGPTYMLVEDGEAAFNLYSSMELFYANGGGDCYIVSAGSYFGSDGKTPNSITKQALSDGLRAIANLFGPTMLVIPDAVLLGNNDCYALQVEMLQQCEVQRDRVAILDVWGADLLDQSVDPLLDPEDMIDAFRAGLAGAPPETLRYGMAYFPNLKTSTLSRNDITIEYFDAGAAGAPLIAALTDAVKHLYPAPDPRIDAINGYVAMIGRSIPDTPDTKKTAPGARTPAGTLTHGELTQALLATIPPLGDLFSHVADSQNLLPPSGAMAGIYTAVDRDSGVWNAPANRGIATLVSPSIEIDANQQQEMNTPALGKAVNVIRTFPARGPVIWGARTLDSTSNDWKYIQVGRTMIFVESSVKTALNAFVFAPNTASTWTTVESMVSSFLHGVWAAGGLTGNSAAEAYSVSCGLGKTMTSDDILNGNMIVTVVLAMVHPAEFIELAFMQQMLAGS